MCVVPSAPEVTARWMNQFASILTSFNETVRSQCHVPFCINNLIVADVYRSGFSSVMELMVRPLTTQSHTLTPPLEEHVTLLQFQLQHVPVDGVTTCLI